MDSTLYQMLLKSAEADKAKALLSLELLGNKAAGIGDHSTEDFYKNAEEALKKIPNHASFQSNCLHDQVFQIF